jgi:membrane dipeptidase
LDRWKKGGLDVQIFSVYCGGVKTPMQLPTGNGQSRCSSNKKPNKIIKVANSEAILKAIKEKKNCSYVWS